MEVEAPEGKDSWEVNVQRDPLKKRTPVAAITGCAGKTKQFYVPGFTVTQRMTGNTIQ